MLLVAANLTLAYGAGGGNEAAAVILVAVESAALVLLPAWSRVVVHGRHHFRKILQ